WFRTQQGDRVRLENPDFRRLSPLPTNALASGSQSRRPSIERVGVGGDQMDQPALEKLMAGRERPAAKVAQQAARSDLHDRSTFNEGPQSFRLVGEERAPLRVSDDGNEVQQRKLVKNGLGGVEHLLRRKLEKQIPRAVEKRESPSPSFSHQVEGLGRKKILATRQHRRFSAEQRVELEDKVIADRRIVVDPI